MSIHYEKIAAATRVKPGGTVDLDRDFDAARHDADLGKEAGNEALESAKLELFALQDKFYAQADRSLLIVLQAIDAGGKDSTVKHVMSGLNPEGDVHSFKAPSATERAHDFLWRHQLALPELGRIAVFNRSHYENVIVTRVHPNLLWPRTSAEPEAAIWHRRYREINDWERHLTENGTVIVKLFLHLSKEEQRVRFLARIDDQAKNWKVSPTDMTERGYWDEYSKAFSEMLSHTSTDYAPWHVIPADHKWYSHLSTFAVLLETMRALNPAYPEVAPQTLAHLGDIKKQLESEVS